MRGRTARRLVTDSLDLRSHARSSVAVALFWSIAGALATAAVLPYAFALVPALFAKVKVPFAVLALAQSVQSGVLLFVLCWVGLRCGAAIGLDSPVVRSWFSGKALPQCFPRRSAFAAVFGVFLGVALPLCDMAFRNIMPSPRALPPYIAFWKRLFAAFYGGVTEECLVRLFLMIVIAWLLLKTPAARFPSGRSWLISIAIIVTAVLFGLGHLPAAAFIWPLTFVVVLRTVLLSAFGGLVFGWLFWRWGFEYAVIAHFVADLVLHGLGSA